MAVIAANGRVFFIIILARLLLGINGLWIYLVTGTVLLLHVIPSWIRDVRCPLLFST